MQWYEAYETISSGGRSRLSNWEDNKWIEEYVNPIDKSEKFIIDQNCEIYDLTSEELSSDNWENVIDPKFDIDKLTDVELHHRVKVLVSSKVLYLKRKIVAFLMAYTEMNDSICNWNYESGLKCYIVYSHVSDKYIVEKTWGNYTPGCVYFNSEEVCKNALNRYKYLLDWIIAEETLMGDIYKNNYSREELESYYYKYS